MKNVIKHKLRNKFINESLGDDKKPQTHLESLCNTMSVKTYEEVIGRLISTIGTKEENPDDWAKIEKPLKMLKEANNQINAEKQKYQMTGDSMVDESNTWWSAIQSTLCK